MFHSLIEFECIVRCLQNTPNLSDNCLNNMWSLQSFCIDCIILYRCYDCGSDIWLICHREVLEVSSLSLILWFLCDYIRFQLDTWPTKPNFHDKSFNLQQKSPSFEPFHTTAESDRVTSPEAEKWPPVRTLYLPYFRSPDSNNLLSENKESLLPFSSAVPALVLVYLFISHGHFSVTESITVTLVLSVI